jgi:hypothetical protein
MLSLEKIVIDPNEEGDQSPPGCNGNQAEENGQPIDLRDSLLRIGLCVQLGSPVV